MPSITYADGPCSHTNALGGCRMSANGVTATVWYYRPEGAGSSPDIQALCKSAGATYVSP